jgi:zinc protease
MTGVFAALALWALPQVTGAGTAGDDAFRRVPPTPAATPSFAVPQPVRFQASGMDVTLVQRSDLPLVSATVVWRTGSAFDPRPQAGLASLCGAVVNEGPARLSKTAFEETQADLAASVGLSVGVEQTQGSVRALSSTFGEALALFAEMLATPGLRSEDFARVQARFLAGVLQQTGSPEALASRLQGRVYWGERHPLGAVVNDASLKAIAAQDCRAFVSRLGPRGARLYVVGDITRETLTSLLAKVLATSRWKGAAAIGPALPAPQKKPGGVVVVDVPGAAQSVVSLVGEGPARAAPNYDAQSVLLAILGGGFSSRVNMNLREKHGYTYGARAGVSYTRTRGVFSMSSSVRTDVTALSVRQLLAELRALQYGDVTLVELARERDGALQGFPARFATGASIADAWAQLDFFGLPLDTWQKTPARLQGLDQATLAAAARVTLPSTLTLFVVGDHAKVRQELQHIVDDGLFGDDDVLRILDVDGRPLPGATTTPLPSGESGGAATSRP